MRLVKTSVGKLWVGNKDNVLDMLDSPPRQIFSMIWNLAEELEFLVEDECKYAKVVCKGAIKDYGVPENEFKFNAQLNLAVNTLKAGGKVLIHCMGGHGRSSTATAILKCKLDGVSVDEALGCVEEYCNGPETKEQEEFVRASNE